MFTCVPLAGSFEFGRRRQKEAVCMFVYVCVGVWVCGCVGVSVCGCVGVSVSLQMHTDKRLGGWRGQAYGCVPCDSGGNGRGCGGGDE